MLARPSHALCKSLQCMLAAVLAFWFIPIGEVNAGLIFDFTYTSEPGNWVGQGESRSFHFDTSQGSTVIYTWAVDPAQPFGIGFSFDNPVGGGSALGSIGFSSDFTALRLTPGFYPSALRFADADSPGLDVVLNSRGNNQVLGDFTIKEMTFVQAEFGNVLKTFEADFSLTGDGNPARMSGTVRYVSDVVAVPEPNSALLTGLFLVSFALTQLRKRRSILDF